MNKLYNGLPLFNVFIEGEDNEFEAVSLVDVPAIGRDFLAFAEQVEVNFSIDDDKRIVTGPVLIPNQPIFRRSDGKEFYIQFSAKTIENMAIRFFTDHSNTNGNLMHQVEVDGITYFESYIIDKQRGICPVEFADLPDGTWCMSAKIDNDDVWKLVKDGVLKGFSIQATCKIERAKEELSTLEDLINELK